MAKETVETRTRVVVTSLDKFDTCEAGINGEFFRVKCGEPVELTDAQIECIKNAVITFDDGKIEKRFTVEIA